MPNFKNQNFSKCPKTISNFKGRGKLLELKAKSLDLRFRILETFDEGKWTQEAATKRFRFLHGLFKKLIMQGKRTGQSKVKALLRKNEA
jgi:hypothetical protein